MKTTSLALLATAACTALTIAADRDPATRQYQVYPKNLARQHLGSNLFLFNAANQTYVPTDAAAAWLDDDVTTGWPALAGKQQYLLALPEPELVSNFAISAKAANGTISLYAADEPAAPGAAAWHPLVKDVAYNSINEKKLAKPFTRFAKYILIETDLSDPGPLYSIYLYGEKPATIYSLQAREQPIDAPAIFGKYVNNQTVFNVNGLYAGATVANANASEGATSWQKAIDDNPETTLPVQTTTTQPGAVIQYGAPQQISRVALLHNTEAKGKVEFFAMKASTAGATATSLEGLTPTVSIVLDGSSDRSSIDFPAIEASQLAMRWSPVVPSESLTVGELESFGADSLNSFEVALKPEAVLAYDTTSKSTSNDGKEMLDPKDPADPKDPLDPVAAGPGQGNYLPGALGFPPNISSRLVRFNRPLSN